MSIFIAVSFFFVEIQEEFDTELNKMFPEEMEQYKAQRGDT